MKGALRVHQIYSFISFIPPSTCALSATLGLTSKLSLCSSVPRKTMADTKLIGKKRIGAEEKTQDDCAGVDCMYFTAGWG